MATGLALLAGYYGGWVDRVVTALTNITMALPNLALTVLLVAYLNPGRLSVIIAISLTAWTGRPAFYRHGDPAVPAALCESEKALGVRDRVIMVKHLIPNLKDIILTQAALAVSSAMMSEAGLSFLGLGDYRGKELGQHSSLCLFIKMASSGVLLVVFAPILCTSLAVLGCMLLGYYGLRNRR